MLAGEEQSHGEGLPESEEKCISTDGSSSKILEKLATDAILALSHMCGEEDKLKHLLN